MKLSVRTTGVAAALTLALAAPLSALAADAMRVVMDPKTGEMRAPNAAETAAFEKAEAQLRAARAGKAGATGAVKTPAPTEIRHPDGSVEMVLGEDTQLYSVVRSDAKGNLTYECLPAKEAQKFVKGTSRKPVSFANKPSTVAKAGQ